MLYQNMNAKNTCENLSEVLFIFILLILWNEAQNCFNFKLPTNRYSSLSGFLVTLAKVKIQGSKVALKAFRTLRLPSSCSHTVNTEGREIHTVPAHMQHIT